MTQPDQLLYFNGRSRAEPIRMLYALADKEFKDDRVAFNDWPQKKLGMVKH